jgi:Domain of unknown function (DUF4271)
MQIVRCTIFLRSETKLVKHISCLCFFLLIVVAAFSQAQDSTPPVAPVQRDTIKVRKPVLPKPRPHVDSIKQAAIVVVNATPGLQKPTYAEVIRLNPYFHFFAQPVASPILERETTGKEKVFYLLIGMLLFLGLIRAIFSRYYQNMLSLFFRVSMKQKQMREQLQQAPLPSLLLNIFFIICGGIYISFLLNIYHLEPAVPYWLLLLYIVLALALVYLGKFLVLRLTGWIFNMQEATSTYIFIIFLINKLLGIFLLPFLVLIAFSGSVLQSVVLTLSYILIFFAFGYRYISAYGPIRREIKVHPFHFFLYLCAFEILPLVLIYKVLLKFLETSS